MKLLSNIAVSESGYLFNPTNGDSFSSNPVATDIISLLKQDKSPEEIKQFILSKYDVEKSTVERDLDEFLQELRDNYLMNSNAK
ncbi:MAG TPA: PqqD family protein [Bacteroidia bacterium]|nr:PqqD family protein [Bacteroidia bacterium]HNP98603.1 PqqD family protein [Bacteroidia bacterium]